MIFSDGCGNPVIYQWIERLKEIVAEEDVKRDINESIDDDKKDIEKYTLEVTPTKTYNIHHGPIIQDRKSVFQGHVCAIESETDVS